MRIPFDLIAALLALTAIREELALAAGRLGARERFLAWSSRENATGEALLALACFWLLVWLAHEGLARALEWRTRWGRYVAGVPGPDGRPPRRHPFETHARGVLLVQALTVGLYAAFLWHYRWPMKSSAWPEWLGLDRFLATQTCASLGESEFAGTLLDLGPFVAAMVLGWIPKRRLAGAFKGETIPLAGWLAFEARLSLLPLAAWLVVSACTDLWAVALGLHPELDAPWLREPWAGAALGVCLLVLFTVVLFPLFMVKLWQCRPLPDGALKERLWGVVRRSGVRVRSILAWGPRGSGLNNACVLGPWAPLRYILVSPGLADVLEEQELDAVVAHELGHIRHGHLTLLIALTIGMAAASEVFLKLLDVREPLLQAVLYLAFIVAYLRLLGGGILRACERQADLAAAEIVGSPQPLASALEKVGVLAGGIRDVYSWHHGSIAQRVECLLRDGLDPEAIRSYHRRVQWMRRAFLLLAFLAAGALVVLGLEGA